MNAAHGPSAIGLDALQNFQIAFHLFISVCVIQSAVRKWRASCGGGQAPLAG